MHIRFEFKQGYTEPSERNCTLQSRSLKRKLFIFLKMKTSESNNMLRNTFFIQFEKSETFLSIQIYIHSFISFQLEPFIQHQVEGQQSLQRYSDLPLPSHGLQHFLEKHYLYSLGSARDHLLLGCLKQLTQEASYKETSQLASCRRMMALL